VKLDPDSKYAWRRPRGDEGRRYEKITRLFDGIFARGGLANDFEKRRIFETGTEGKALILSCPAPARVDSRLENLGSFKIKVEVPGSDAYEVKVKQSFWKDEWERMKPGTTVACSVDPDNPKRVLLVSPEPPPPDPALAKAKKSKKRGKRFKRG
jgi:hypothetical protein